MTKKKAKPSMQQETPLPEHAEPGTPVNPPVEAESAAEADLGVHPKAGFPIVGIGASAGGLAAFEAFFSGMPAETDPGMAFVLVQHLAPDHKSILSDLVKRYTRMQVFEVEDGMAVKPNCAYIIPPNRDMAFLDGTLQLLEPAAPRGHRLPIDFFFRSLAQDQHERAICIVLSGTGSDGTQGVRAIKGEGGMVMAQNPESTEYDGMPRSAIATGLVDYVLPPAEMPAQLIAYVAHAFGKTPRPGLSPGSQGRRRDEEGLYPAARPDRPRFFAVQTKHDQPPRRAAHGGPPDRTVERVRPLLAADPGRSGGALSRSFDRRHQFLPRPGGVRGAQGTGHPATFCRQGRGRSDPRLGARLLHRRGSLFHRHPAPGADGTVEAEFQGAGVRHGY